MINSPLKKIKLLTVLVLASLLSFQIKASAAVTMEQNEVEDDGVEMAKGFHTSEEEQTDWFFSRFAIQLAPFAEMDLELTELKVQPYVELRYNRKSLK